MDISDILAALGVILNGLPQGLLAMSLGFASIPTSLGFFIGAICCFAFNSLAPISFQAETIVMAHTLGKNIRETLSMIFFGGLIMLVVGILGLQQAAVNLSGPIIINAMMAGVGIVLGRLALNMIKEARIVALSSILSAAIIYFFLGHDLVYTICGSVIISSIIHYVMKTYCPSCLDKSHDQAPAAAATPASSSDGAESTALEDAGAQKLCGGSIASYIRTHFVFHKPQLSVRIIRGALAMTCLNVGANIAFGNITASLAHGSQNIDILSIYSSLADVVTSLFGGAPVEAIISATASAHHPVTAGIIMMVAMGALLFCGLLPKIGKFIPAQSIAGFLLILGIVVTVGNNAPLAFGGATPQDAVVAATTMGATAFVDPFVGMVLGVVLKSLFAAGLCL